MKMNSQKIQFAILAMGIMFVMTGIPAQASLKEIKNYKEAFPDTKPKCINCHKDEKPKKEDGQHDPNEYGEAVLSTDKEPTADTYKKVGKIEDFKKN